MCGIHGVVTGLKREPKADSFVKQGFITGSLRGIDSSGMASINAMTSETAWQKLPVMGPMFVGDKLMQRLSNDACAAGMVTICHTRAATSGPIGMNEAHPFYVSDTDGRELIGCHNGSLTGWSTKKGAKDFKVDSEWAMNHIFDEGFDAFEDFAGAFVFVWWDSKTSDTFNIALNEARPLFIAFTDAGNMLYASEAGMLYWLAERNEIKLDGQVRKLMPNFWYKFDLSKLKEYTKTALPTRKTTSSTSSGNAYPSTAYQRPDHVASVKKVLDLISNQPSAQPNMALTVPQVQPPIVNPQGDLLKPIKKGVTAEEVIMAKDRLFMGVEGEFHPLWDDDDSGEVWGTLVLSETHVEMDAIIRNGLSLSFTAMKDIWKVKVIGLNDDGFSLVAICTHPIGQRQAKPETAAA